MYEACSEGESYAATQGHHSEARRPARHSGADAARIWGRPPDGGTRPGGRGPARLPLCPGSAPASPQRECALASGVAGPTGARSAGSAHAAGHALGRVPLGGPWDPRRPTARG